MKKIIILCIISLHSFLSFSQIDIKGVVRDKEEVTLPGVNVLLKGTKVGTVTDINGRFQLEVPDRESTLVFSYVGYKAKEVQVRFRTEVEVQLESTLQSLSDVVVVGYGVLQKRDVTGSVSKVKTSDNEARQYTSVDALLQGRSSGVQVTSNSGTPGSAVSVRVRGTNSLRGNNEPLYVIDGVIINSAAEDVRDPSSDANEIQSAQNGLTGLNPRDIESIELLKDASATAIYGSRGANGVILITTKKGVRGEAKVNVYGSICFSQMSNKIDMLDAFGYAKYINEFQLQVGGEQKYEMDQDNIYILNHIEDPDAGAPSNVMSSTRAIDWQDEIYQMGITHIEGVSVSGTSNKTQYYISGGYTDQQGFIETSNLQKGDFRLNLTNNLSSSVKLDTRFSGIYQKGSFSQAGSKAGGPRSFPKQVLTYSPIESDQELGIDQELEVSSPYTWLIDYQDETSETRVNGYTSVSIRLLTGLTYKTQVGLDYRNKQRSRFWDRGVFKGKIDNGVLATSTLLRYSYSLDNLLMYNRNFENGNRLASTIAFTYDESNSTSSIYETKDFPFTFLGIDSPQVGRLISRPYSLYKSKQSILSLLARLNFTLKDKYIFTGSIRADGSSKFSKGNKYGYFPAGAFAWRIGEEPIIKSVKWIDNLKFRAGWGKTGNQAIGPYSTFKNYATVYAADASDNFIIGSVPTNIKNSDLTWEVSSQYNTGLDISFFDQRVSLVADVYYKTTSDLLQSIEIGASNGYRRMLVNRGEIENKGVELSLDVQPIRKDDISLSIGANISFNKNKIRALGLSPSEVYINGESRSEIFYYGTNVSTGLEFKCPANIFMEGQPIGMFWGYQTDGIFQSQTAADNAAAFRGQDNQAGDVCFIDQNKDGVINNKDMTFIGNPNPDLFYGMNINLSYKRFRLSALLNGVYGVDIANGVSLSTSYPTGNGKNITETSYANAWRENTPNNTSPRIGYRLSQYFTDRIVEDGSFLRLSNVTCSYDIIRNKFGLDNVNLYVTGSNLLTVTNYSGYDPEVTSFMFNGGIMGVDWSGSPNSKSILVGLNVTF
ncbi:TonB-dependent receptor [Halosquirtibacter xylanolyticus]|uniref:SusC/RagA family TonB-linked outer membrane protein n=1 Tax=Halosquirtibacter xylanolyticus TaxID=3374599 RepID=UPI00374A21BF|nr:TonB-dependent receptor [Prolixibacteraceae bacterium]